MEDDIKNVFLMGGIFSKWLSYFILNYKLEIFYDRGSNIVYEYA